jgi:crotonobetainyl-CoA:carnitine CoA-transferase CaiB-like acyl-CoA transferase
VKHVWEEAFKEMTQEGVIKLIQSYGGDAVPLIDYPTLFAHSQIQAIDAIKEIEHPTVSTFTAIGPAWRFFGTPAAIQSPPPTFGQHTEEILKEMGVSPEEIQKLRALGVVG